MNVPAEQSLAGFLEAPTRFLFFTGKGGVGKTSLACASAIALADGGKRVLLVSTDPASNLDEVLGVRLTSAPTAVPNVTRFAALNIDPAAAAAAYRERLVGPYRSKPPEAIVRNMEEQLSGACTMEIAAFDEFSRSLGEPEATADFDHVIFDTAPTGHTLRLLSLPGAWTGFFDNSSTGNSCLGPLAGLEKQRVIYEGAVASLAAGGRTTLVLVSRAQRAALTEAERTSDELAAIGVRNQRLILNGLFEADAADPVALALQQRGEEALAAAKTFLTSMPLSQVPLRSHNLVGIPALRALILPEEDLRSPCAEEIAVFRAFARTVAQGKDAFVVLDTAPTGPPLLLLDATESYHREVARKSSDMPEEVKQLLPRLRDGEFTRVLVVTLPEATPVHEAAMLQSDLRRAHIEPFAWVINQSFAESGSRDPLLVARGRGEAQFIREVVEQQSKRTSLVPWVTEEPAGPERLEQLFATATVH